MHDNCIRQLVHIFTGADLQLEIIWIYSQTAKCCQNLSKIAVGNVRNFMALYIERKRHSPQLIRPEGFRLEGSIITVCLPVCLGYLIMMGSHKILNYDWLVN